jgi:hypothetical protein
MKADRSMKVLALVLSMGVLTSLLAACGATDVVARYAVSSFDSMATAMGASMKDGLYLVESPGGDHFRLAPDFSGSTDALLSMEAGPFLAAGLDPARLPVGQDSSWTVADGRLVGRFDLAPGGKASSTKPGDLMAMLASSARARIGYHAQMGHYGIMLDDHAMVEWAADALKNDKDWVVILDPGLVEAAGGNAEAVEGWILAMVPVDGPDGKMVEVQKLLRPFDIIK